MGPKQRRWIWTLLVAVSLIGCGAVPEEPPGTGAKECVQGYFEALIQQDWPKAYAALDPQSQGRCNQQQFSQLARNYRSSLGFEPKTILLRACEERGTQATAHVVLTGRTTTQERRYKDAVTLRRGDTGWHVVLPSNFGRAKKKG
jgi:hypothetical protein